MSTDLLKRCPLFAGLTDKDLKGIRAIASYKRAGRKEILFADGEGAKGFYVILSGKVKLYKISPEGKEQILHRHGHPRNDRTRADTSCASRQDAGPGSN